MNRYQEAKRGDANLKCSIMRPAQIHSSYLILMFLTTPVVIKDNKVAGWGNNALERVSPNKVD